MAALRAWWTEIPKSASTTLSKLFGVQTGTITYAGGPTEGEVGLPLAHPVLTILHTLQTALHCTAMHTL